MSSSFSATAGTEGQAEIRITAMDPLLVPKRGSQDWTSLYGPAQDIWHVYKWGHHWISFSFETNPNNLQQNERKLGVLKVRHTRTGGTSAFQVVDIIWVVNDTYATEGTPVPIDRLHGIHPHIDRPNDHFMVAWGGHTQWSTSPIQLHDTEGQEETGGLAIGERKSGPDSGIQFIHLDSAGNYIGHSFVGSRNGPSGPLACGGTGCSGHAGHDNLVHPPMTQGDVVHLFTSQNLDLPGNNPSAITHIEVTPGLQATHVPSFPGLVRVDTGIVSSSTNLWHFSMPSAVRLGYKNEYWLLTYRAVGLTWNQENGAIFRQAFSWPGFTKVGAAEQVSVGTGGSRPHAVLWKGRYLVTCFYEDRGQGNVRNWVKAEEVTLPTPWQSSRVALG